MRDGLTFGLLFFAAFAPDCRRCRVCAEAPDGRTVGQYGFWAIYAFNTWLVATQ